MEDLSEFAVSHPDFCDPKAVRVPGHDRAPAIDGGRPFELSAESLSTYRVEAAKDPSTLPNMLKMGPEAVAFYVSFRLDPARWGIYVREGALRALKEEYHRIIWRDLGKYADRNVDDVAEKVETTLVLDYLLAHNRIHFLVDRAAAEWEIQTGAAKYSPYQAKWYNAPPKPVLNPEDVGNIEEALANLEAFRQYINPTYADGVAKLVEGRLDERNVNEWKAFFIGGRFAVEMANVLSRQPPGWKDFGKFLNRKTSVGATNYVRIQYSYNPEMLERGQVELSRRLSGGSAETPNLFKAEAPAFPNVYLL
ncbi:MAG: hypothetical protein E6K01_09305 [Methanobacteriota archaeon]|nr:MAG: hypothetical protein E6K01_09305 [Euryarchaeota archaeon]